MTRHWTPRWTHGGAAMRSTRVTPVEAEPVIQRAQGGALRRAPLPNSASSRSLKGRAVALLELFPRAAGARVVATDIRPVGIRSRIVWIQRANPSRSDDDRVRARRGSYGRGLGRSHIHRPRRFAGRNVLEDSRCA